MLVYTMAYPSEFYKAILPKMSVEPGYKPNVTPYTSDESCQDVLYFPFQDNSRPNSPVKFVMILHRMHGAYCFNILPDINFDIDSKVTKREVISALESFIKEFEENIQIGLVTVSADVLSNAQRISNSLHAIHFFSGGDNSLPQDLAINICHTFRKTQAGSLGSAFRQAMKSLKNG